MRPPSVDSPSFRVEHLRPEPTAGVEIPAEQPHCLHAIRGGARFLNAESQPIGELDQGESAIVPIGVGAYRVESVADVAEIIKVSLPIGA